MLKPYAKDDRNVPNVGCFNLEMVLSRSQILTTLMLCFFSATTWATILPVSIDRTIKTPAEQFIERANEVPHRTIIDSRILGDRQQGFIEGSYSLSDVETNYDRLTKIIAKKNTPTLYYCNDAKAMVIARRCGYNNIYWFRGGFEECSVKGYPYIKE